MTTKDEHKIVKLHQKLVLQNNSMIIYLYTFNLEIARTSW